MSTTSSTPGCDDSYYTLFPASWPNGYYGYQANLGNFPAGDETRQEITKGHHSWDYTNNPCGFNDITDLVSDYDVYNVATHESGHSIGVDGDYEADTHGNLTMYCCAYHGETKDRSLARGDILGMRDLYP